MNLQDSKSERKVRSLETKVARLESINDQLIAELQYVDQLLRLAGFDNGLQMAKMAASELIEEERYGT